MIGQPSSLLVLRPGALGDLLLGLPALKNLAEQNRGIRIEVAANERYLPLLGLAPFVAGCRDFGGVDLLPLFSPSPKPGPDLIRQLSQFDGALLWMADPRECCARNLRAWGVKQVMGGNPRAGRFEGGSMARRLADLAGLSRKSRLDLATLETTGQGEGRVTVHPGAGGRHKRWPPEHYLELVQKVARAGYRTQVLLGPADQDLLPFWQDPVRTGSELMLLQPAEPMDLARRISGSALFVGNDSGPAHLAAALGVPTLVLFGPTDPAVWRPRGPRVVVLKSLLDSWPSRQEVLSTALGLLA